MPESIHRWQDERFKEWQAERMAVYAAQVASIDRSTGRLLDVLRRNKQLDNTLVLFLSDNGAAPDGGLKPVDRMLGFVPGLQINSTFRRDRIAINPGSSPQNLPGPSDTFQAYGLAWAQLSVTPFRSTKLSGYEGGIRTPMIAHWPVGIRSRGEIVHDVGHVMDLMPTFIELAGTQYPASFADRHPLPLDGISLGPVFRGEATGMRGEIAWRVPQHRVLRSGSWKIISKDAASPWELYNLATDAGETSNVANTHPELLDSLTKRWEEWAAACANKP
jgi:arylsulfatase